MSTPRPIGVQQQFSKIPVLGLVAEHSATAPTSPVNGQTYYDTALNRLRVRENGAWADASQAGSEMVANKGQIDGYAPLDASAQVPLVNLPVAPSGNSSATALVRADDARLSDERTPVDGSVTGAKIADGSVTGGPAGAGVKIAANTVTHDNVAAANKDGAAATPSMRTLGTGAAQAMAGNTRLDQISAPTAAVSLNAQRLTNVALPTSGTDVANKDYVDSVSAGLDPKGSVRVASTANVAATYNATGGTSGRGQFTAAPDTLDGITLAAGDRILLKNQTSGDENGIVVVTTVGTGATGVWDRAGDFDTDAEVTAGAFTFVEEGNTNDNTGWVLTTNNPITIGGASGSALGFTQFSGGASLSAGAGMVQNGNAFDVVGTANRILVNADSIDIAATYVGQTSITTLGTITTGVWEGTTIAIAHGGTGATTATGARTALGATGKYAADLGAMTAGVEVTVTHNLNTEDVVPSFRTNADGVAWELGWRVIGVNSIGVTADIAFAANAVRAVVTG